MAADLVNQLFAVNPDERIGGKARGGYSSLKAHPWFAGIDFDNLETSVKPESTPLELEATRICEVR